MNDEQVERILNDTLNIEQDEEGIAADFACHIKALADERERLQEGLKMITQLRSDRVPCMIASAVLRGADLRIHEEAIAVCEGKWRTT